MVYILKGGRSSTRAPSAPTYEQKLLGINGQAGMIERGALTDKDINFILDSGDKELQRAFDTKFRKEKKNSEHVQRIYGKDFVNKDNNGNLYKDVVAYDPGTVGTGRKEIETMKKILNK